MKKRMLSLLLVLVMLLGLLPTAALAAPASGGSGTAADPYLIATAQDLVDFRDEVNGSSKKSTSKLCAKLTAILANSARVIGAFGRKVPSE